MRSRSGRHKSSNRRAKTASSRMITPGGLQLGDSVAIIRPAAKIDSERYERTKEIIRDFGFFVAEYADRAESFHYFAANDEFRKKEFCWAMSEPAIKAILCCRAGYGSMRMAELVSQDEIKKFQPKIFAGYSDVTYLHQWIQNKLSWKSFHAPLVGMIEEEALRQFLQQLLDLSKSAPKEVWDEVDVIQKGEARAPLLGGNLSMLRVAGPAKLPEKPFVLAIEEVGEEYYAIDRLIWNLIDAGYSRWIKGIIVGHLHDCGRKDSETFPIEMVQESLKRLCPRGPILWGAQFGHGLQDQRVLPLGQNLRIQNNELHWSETFATS